MNCHSKNVLYVIICDGCNEFYIGKTDRKLSERMNLHRSQIKNPHNRTIPLSDHLERCANGKYRVFPFFKLPEGNSKLLELMESKFICKYRPGLNAKTLYN